MVDDSVPSGIDVHKPAPPRSDEATAQDYLDQLAAELRDRGLRVAVKTPALTATNIAVTSQDRPSEATSLRLCQSVLIRHFEGLGFYWCWVFPSMRSAVRGVPTPPPKIRPMRRASDIVGAADRIVNVVRLQDDELVRSARGV